MVKEVPYSATNLRPCSVRVLTQLVGVQPTQLIILRIMLDEKMGALENLGKVNCGNGNGLLSAMRSRVNASEMSLDALQSYCVYAHFYFYLHCYIHVSVNLYVYGLIRDLLMKVTFLYLPVVYLPVSTWLLCKGCDHQQVLKDYLLVRLGNLVMMMDLSVLPQYLIHLEASPNLLKELFQLFFLIKGLSI